MSKPHNIILVRHGQSEGNVDKSIYLKKPEYTCELTELGKQQAFQAGQKIKKILYPFEGASVKYYISPFWRTRQTFQQISKTIISGIGSVYEDPRLRGQEYAGGWRDGIDYLKIEKDRTRYGTFYYRLPNGQSGADVYDRMSDFLNTLHRDFEKENYPENCIIVTHGMAMRCFLMRFFHYSVEYFETLANPKNAEFWVLEKDKYDDYRLVTPIKFYKKQLHNWQFDWKKE